MSNKSRDNSSYLKSKYKPYGIADLPNNFKLDDNFLRMSSIKTPTNISDYKYRKSESKSSRKNEEMLFSINSIPKSLADKLLGVLESSTKPISKNLKRNADSVSIQIPDRSSTLSPSSSIYQTRSPSSGMKKKTSQESFKLSQMQTQANTQNIGGVDLHSIGSRIKDVLENYKKREEMLIQRCKFLEAELAKYKSKDGT